MDPLVQEQSAASTVKPDRRSSERRLYPRFELSATANLGNPGGGPTSNARLADISLAGCYFDMSAPSPVGTRLQISFEVEKERLEAIAEVKFAVPWMGMGVQFISMSDQSRAVLKSY